MGVPDHLTKLLRITRLNTKPAPYLPILELQQILFEQRKCGAIGDTWLLLQHSHTYTMGKRGSENDFPQGMSAAIAAGAQIHTIPRGGETTYHGPGQLVVYPIVNLRELQMGPRAFVESLEDVMIRTVGSFGINAKGRFKGRTGVWVGDRKIGAIGVKISSGITSHGMALNVNPDLEYFKYIVPCGQPDKGVTSIEQELVLEEGRSKTPINLELVANIFTDAIASQFGYTSIEQQPYVSEYDSKIADMI